ncbi:MAG: hypothetical protein AAF492_18955, partial [Verrucomicrobiota bacterium]
MNECRLTYRGSLKALAGSGTTLGFVTEHNEGQATALYRFEVEKQTLNEIPLPSGAVALLADGDDFWIAGNEAGLFHAPAGASSVKTLETGFTEQIIALARLSNQRLAVLSENLLGIIDTSGGALLRTIELEARGTAMAADPTGDWLAVGNHHGAITVFEAEGRDTFERSESGKLHEGAVTAMVFEPEELRFFSAGADGRFLLTHARGTLEPEDRGRSHGH